jgi:CheY-like chemotaxis protein
MSQNNNLLFNDDIDIQLPEIHGNWKILIVDDESSVHDVTRLALNGFVYESKGLEFLHAYSGIEAIKVMENHNDIALVIVDVVMEKEHARAH